MITEVKGKEQAIAKLREAQAIAEAQAERLVLKAALMIVREAKILAPVDTGRLRNSIAFEKTGPKEAIVFDGVDYGCVLGGDTLINCGKNGHKRIANIRAGDRILTQDGKLHTVLGITRFYATKKPDMIEIIAEYRKDRTHKLVLTADHKVLRSSNDCNEWVPAKDLKVGDELFSPIKRNFNIKAGERISRECLPNVFYMQCNKSLHSFVNPLVFKRVRVLALRPFVYQKSLRHPAQYLYDLAVDGMHSFIASGLLISNSYVEYGTSRMKAQPFFRPAISIVKGQLGLELQAAKISIERV